MNDKTPTEKIKGELGAIERAYKMTKEAQDTFGLCQMLVCCRGIEFMHLNMLNFINAHAKEIQTGELVVFGFCSGKETEEHKEIPTVTMNLKKLDEKDEDKNKRLVWAEVFKRCDEHKDFIIFHVQMLGVGTDLPSLNSVLILGDKNETDLFQSVMRGCRIDPGNPNKKSYHVFIYVDKETEAYMKKFIDTLDKLGGPELIKAFSNDVQQGKTGKNNQSLFQELLTKYISSSEVTEEYQKLINCKDYILKQATSTAVIKKMMEYQADGKMSEYNQLRAMWLRDNLQ